MTIKDQLTPEQWKSVFSAPMAAATYVASSSGGMMEMSKELFEVSKFMSQEAAAGDANYGELVSDYLGVLKGMSRDEMKAAMMQPEKGPDMNAMRAQYKQVVADAWTAIAAMPGADGFARWLLQVGQTAAMTKTGGHFGIGNKSVIDAQEQAALDELAAVLSVPAS